MKWVADYYRVPFTARQRERTDRLVSAFLGFTRPSGRVLDVGCGRGEKSALFPRGAYIGIDPINPVTAGILPTPSVPMVTGVGEALPFVDGQFTSVILFGVLDHVADRSRVFSEVARVLAPGGRLCLFNQVVGARGNTAVGLARWVIQRILTGDLLGLLRIARFTLASPGGRSFAQPLTVARVVQEVNGAFREVEHAIVEEHSLVLRALR